MVMFPTQHVTGLTRFHSGSFPGEKTTTEARTWTIPGPGFRHPGWTFPVELKALLCRRPRSEPGTRVHQSAVDEDGGPVDVAATVTGQKCDHAGDLGRLRHPAERDGRVQHLHRGRVVHRCGVDRSRDRTRADVDDPDAVRAEFLPGRA